MTVPHTLDVALMAFSQDKNLIITNRRRSGVVNATINSVLEVTKKVILVESHRLELLDLDVFDARAEVIIFAGFESASTSVKGAVRELLKKKGNDGVPGMPNLKTVVVLMFVPNDADHLTDDTEAVARELGDLGPSIVISAN